MSADDMVTLSGLPGSPYTRKMLALLRYRRIPYSFISRDEARARGLPEPRVPLHPTFYMKGRRRRGEGGHRFKPDHPAS